MAINCYAGGGGLQTAQCTACGFYHQLYGIGKTAAEGLHFLCGYAGQPPTLVDLTLVAGPTPGAIVVAALAAGGWKTN